MREALAERGIKSCIPGRAKRKEPIVCDTELYKSRNLIERLFGRFKDWRRIATRYDRCAHTFYSAICIAATVSFWLCVLSLNVNRPIDPARKYRTNRVDFWTVSRTNRRGFVDREPLSPERAAGSCHIAMIGDFMVVAHQVPIPDKFHVRLKALATRKLPDLDITTSAFGFGGSGQIMQLPFYDE